MQWMSLLKLGWLNGWIPLSLLVLTEGLLLALFPRKVSGRLLDRSSWSTRQKIFTVIGKAFSLVCLVLIVLTPLKTGSPLLIVGAVLYAVGLVGLVKAIFDFRHTPLGQPVTRGLYRISRNPQIVSLFLLFLGMCIAIGSWPALIALLLSKAFQHLGIMAEEEACLEQYGDAYRAYTKDVPRYLLFF